MRHVPGYAEALRAEAQTRSAPFIDAAVELCGVEVRPLTIRDYERLAYHGSPFVCGGSVDRADIAFLIGHQRHPEPVVGKAAARRFAARFDALDLGEMITAASVYVDSALMDAPRGSGKGSPFASLAASVVHAMRAAYQGGISRAEVLDMDLREAFAYLRLIRRDADPQAVLFNPLSDRAKADFLASLSPP